MESLTITAHTEDSTQINAIKAFMKAMKIKFEIIKTTKKYNPKFIEKIKQNQEDYKNGKGEIVTIEQLLDLCK